MYFKKTRCPHCKTLYRITFDQLTISHGQVLCGICREYFNAIEYLDQSETLDYQQQLKMQRQINLNEERENDMTHPEIIQFFQQKSPKSPMTLLEYLNSLEHLK